MSIIKKVPGSIVKLIPQIIDMTTIILNCGHNVKVFEVFVTVIAADIGKFVNNFLWLTKYASKKMVHNFYHLETKGLSTSVLIFYFHF